METINTYWAARNRDGLLFLHRNCPSRNEETGAWESDNRAFLYDTTSLDFLRWEDEPIALDYKLKLQ